MDSKTRYEYTIGILQGAATKLGGEILTQIAIKGRSGDIEQMATKILFGGLPERTTDINIQRFNELVEVINLLQGK